MFDDRIPRPAIHELRQELSHLEDEIAALRARQVRILRQLNRRSFQMSRSDIAGELDVSGATASALQETAMRTPEKSTAMQNLEGGDWTFDRAASMAALVTANADDRTLREAEKRDIAGIRKLRAMVRRTTRRDERRAFEERHVRLAPSLDDSVGFLHAQLPAYGLRVVAKALDERADTLPRDARSATMEQRRADALVAMALDWLDGTAPSGRTSGPIAHIVVDGSLAAPTKGESGVMIAEGPRVGPQTLEHILCSGTTEIVVERGAGVPLRVGPASRGIGRKERRYIVHRDGGCTIDGCESRYRLEVHHIVPRQGERIIPPTSRRCAGGTTTLPCTAGASG